MKKIDFEREIIIDEPSKKDFFKGKGHERTALSLARAISDFEDTDRAIGLDGPWGSGKSSIVEIAERHLKQKIKTGGTKFHFFTFDIWKSQGSAFRRTFLEHFVSWAKKEFPQKKTPLEKIEKRIKGKTRHLTTDNNPMLDWYGVAILVILPFLPIFYFWAKEVFDDAKGKEFLTSTPMLLLYIFLFATVVRALLKYFFDNKDGKKSILESLSRTLLITAKQYENQEITQHIREVDPNDFEFQETLIEILKSIQGEKNKTVLVLDNIDRIPSEEIEDYWSAVRSIFSKNTSIQAQSSETAITAIVPYDRAHIQAPDTTTQENQTAEDPQNTQATLSKRELFSKTFDEILYVAPSVMSNSREFFEEKISSALPNFKKKDELFRVYLIFNSCLSNGNGHFTPRQIISFINELTSLFAMHQGQFPLSTVAVYICFREKIEQNPLILANPTFLNARLRKLAPDDDIEQNLAAILYNVDREFALELLLDGRIASASVLMDETSLVELSKSHGFDLRVDEVIQNHTEEWISSGDFGRVVQNYSALAKVYNGAAKQQITDSLLAGFASIHAVSLSKNEYRPFFGLLKLCEDTNLSTLVSNFITKGLNHISDVKELNYSIGEEWVDFLDELRDQLKDENKKDSFDHAVSKVTIPSNPDFMLGVAYNSHHHNIPLTKYKKVSIVLAAEDETLEGFAKENYHLSKDAFTQLNNVKIVPDNRWISIGNAIIETLQADETPDEETCRGLLETLASVWIFTPDIKRSDISVSNLLESSNLYKNLHSSFGNDKTDIGIAHAVFLARQIHIEKELPLTLEHQNNTISQEETDGFDWFKSFYDGKADLSEEQLKSISQHVKDAAYTTRWINAGRAGDNPLIENVVKTIFSFDVLPWVSLSTILTNFLYLRRILGDQVIEMLEKFGKHDHDKELQKLKLADVPVGVLHATVGIEDGSWPKLHETIQTLLEGIPLDQWEGKMRTAEHEVRILDEKVGTSGIEISSTEFRVAFQKFALDTLNGTIAEINNEIDYDLVFNAIPKSFHGDVYRQTREKLADVSALGLELAIERFPNFLNDMISTGEKIMSHEKDNVIRHLLSTALEANNRRMLENFLAIGRPKIANFLKSSQDSTKDKISGSMGEFAKLTEDRDFTESVSDLINGKRKTKTFMDAWLSLVFGSSDNDEDVEEEDL